MLVEKIILKVSVALAVMALCFTLGFAVANSKQKDKQIEAATITQTDSNKEVLAGQAKSVEIEDKVAASAQKIESIKQEAVRRVLVDEPKVITKTVTVYKCPGESHVSNANDGDPMPAVSVETSRPWSFSNGVVRLLDSARTNDTDSTASSNDASDQTTSDVTVSDLVENDLEVVGLYHDQSERFKALQDYVKDKQDQGYMFCKAK